MTIRHRFVSAIANGTDLTQIQPTRDWNDSLVVSGDVTGDLVVRDTSDADGANYISTTGSSAKFLRGGGSGVMPAYAALVAADTRIVRNTLSVVLNGTELSEADWTLNRGAGVVTLTGAAPTGSVQMSVRHP